MPLCSRTSSWVASGSKTTLNVKGFRAPLASSTWTVQIFSNIFKYFQKYFAYPDLALSWELNDPLVIGPLFLLADGSDSDDDVDVVSVTVGAGVVALRLQGAVEGLPQGGRASGAERGN